MIDIENLIFNRIATILRSNYSPISVYGEFVRAPAIFPCVTIEEKDNFTYERTQTDTENHVSVMYEVNVYSNLTKRKKSQCKAIFGLIDNEMQLMGFTRVMVDTFPDEDIYRMIGRFRAVVSNGHKIYRRY